MRATMVANELARRQTQTVTAIRQASHSLTVATQGKGFSEITGALASWLTEIGGTNGLLTVFVRHTSASLTIQENADPNVQRDLLDALEAFAPEGADYAHQEEGPDDMPSHIKAMLTSVSLGIPVVDGKMTLGTWQGVYLIEHRASPHRRTVVLSFIGEARS
ncbi:MAG: secondary thiamine-phosphate synthase enzyme YjbQ [Methyloceanibacter sp.]|jgi:secondary thiamine-phosphate synthase enzyme